MKECKSCKKPKVTIKLKEFDHSLTVKIARFIESQCPEFQLCGYLSGAVSMKDVHDRYLLQVDHKFSLWSRRSFFKREECVAGFSWVNVSDRLVCRLYNRNNFLAIKEICEKVSLQFDIEVEITDGLSS